MINIDNLSRSVPEDDNTYLAEDGLLHCTKCGGYRQTVINPFGLGERKVKCLCECMVTEQEKADQECKREENDRQRKICFAESNMWKWTFESDDGKNEKLSDAMKNYVNNFQKFKADSKGLLLWGSVGTGKSYMAACVANALIDKGQKVLMTNFARLTNEIQGRFEGKQAYIDSLNLYQLLIIDDLGAERKSEFMQEMVFNIVDSRYRSGLPMIVTTNLTIDEITKPVEVGSSRIYDRLLERCYPIEVNGTSRRRQNVRESVIETKKLLGL